MLSNTRQARVILTLACLAVWCKVAVAQDHPCARPCMMGQPPMECDYSFVLENYRTMSKACYSCPYIQEDCSREDCVAADGVGRDIITINRQIPGPKIEVCVGDHINVAVRNALLSDSSTIHWHGQHQMSTPYMDGVPFVTQCPILPLSTFTYRFPAVQPGTHFYHSHISLQRGDGMFGALIVRQPPEQNPHRFLYDHDLSSHVLIINDWNTEGGLQAYLANIHSGVAATSSSILVNGKGRLEEFTADDGTTLYTPVERFDVQPQQRYRFRIINNGILGCPVQISVDNHMITVISTDANDIEPVVADSLVTYPGERYDIVINANQFGGVHWIRFRGLSACANTETHQLAILHYAGAPNDAVPQGPTDYEASERDGLQVNSPGVGVEDEDEDTLTVAELRGMEFLEPQLFGPPDVQYIVPLSIHQIDNPVHHKPGVYGFNDVTWGQQATPQIAFSSMQLLPFPLLSQRNSIPANSFCNVSTIADSCQEEYCSCIHVAEIPLGSSVEMIFYDEFQFTNHPIHIHGLSFRVMGIEAVGEALTPDRIRELDADGLLVRNFDHPPLKDTIQVPGYGYTIIRFLATNPGYWFMHCHLEHHAEELMAMTLKFGEHEDMLPVPQNFPTCGDYDPLNP